MSLLFRRLAYLERALQAWRRIGANTRVDHIRLATWSLEIGRDVEPEELVAADQAALRPYGMAEQLAAAAHAAGHPEAPTLVAEALEKAPDTDALDALPAGGADASGRIVRAANLYWVGPP